MSQFIILHFHLAFSSEKSISLGLEPDNHEIRTLRIDWNRMWFYSNNIFGLIVEFAFLNQKSFMPKTECLPFSFFLNFISFYWRIVDLQCCVNFCYAAMWLRYTHIYNLVNILFHYDLSQDIECSSPVLYSRTSLFISTLCFMFWSLERGEVGRAPCDIS